MDNRSVPEFAAYLIALDKGGGSSGFTVDVFDGAAYIDGITAIDVGDVMIIVGVNEITATVIQDTLHIA